MKTSVPANARSARLEAIVTRADGRVENLGAVAYWHRNPIIRAFGNFWIKVLAAIRNAGRTGR